MKKITYAVIFMMIFHFSISGVYASNAEEEALNIEEASENSSENSERDMMTENTSENDDSVIEKAEEGSAEEADESSEELTETSNEPEAEESAADEEAAEDEAESAGKAASENLPEEEEEALEDDEAAEMSLFSVSAIELPYKQGDHHDDIIPVKQKLNALGFNRIAESGNFGSFTAKRVREFQAYYGLAVTGQVDQITLDKLDEVYNSPYQKGNSNTRTAEAKKMLNALGYGRLAEGPVFGNLTERRVKEFQRDHGLMAHGILDDPTFALLQSLSSNKEFKQGDSHPDIIPLKQKLNALGFNRIAESGNYGSFTARRVSEFQEYYGLPATGIADKATQEKLDEIYNSPHQNGSSSARTAEAKNMLNHLGYGGLSKGPVFGNLTERRVKEFQRDHGLKAHGIIDDPTFTLLEYLFQTREFKQGDNHPDIIPLKQKLNALRFGGIAETGNYGSFTAKRVREFQEYYGLPATGVADKATQEKLNEIYNSPYQNGNSNEQTAEMKEMLSALGYSGLSKGPVFGNLTERRLKQFQSDHGLKAHGIADSITMSKLKEVYENRAESTTDSFNLSLEEALNNQMAAAPQTDDRPGYISGEYAEVTGRLAGNSHVRVQPTSSSASRALLSAGTRITILDQVRGESLWAGDAWYKVRYNGIESYIYANLITDIRARVVDVNLRVRQQPNLTANIYATLPPNTTVGVASFENDGWLRVNYGWINAHPDNVIRFLDPARNDEYQHLDLSSSLGLTASQLNDFLDARIGNRSGSVLRNQGETFKNAAAQAEQTINELYLISHALLETGYGTSDLSSGRIQVGELASNTWVVFLPAGTAYTAEQRGANWSIRAASSYERNSASNLKPTYNMFGIQAVDSAPNIRGSIHAYRQGWDTVEKAIIGGAEFIAGDYIHNQYNQNTLYKMRWNPLGMETHGYATKQYATDIRWAVKQVGNIKAMLSEVNLLDSPLLRFNFIQYK